MDLGKEGFTGAGIVRASGLGTMAADKAHRLDFMTALQFIYVYLYKNLMSAHLCLTYFWTTQYLQQNHSVLSIYAG